MSYNPRQRYAIESKNKDFLLKLNPNLNDRAGIYFLTRIDEYGRKHGYIGQAGGVRKGANGTLIYVKQGILTRLAQHMVNHQHIDLSIKAHGWYSKDNPYGYKVNFLNFRPEELNDKEEYYIEEYLKAGYILKNKTAGRQDKGKRKIDEYKPSKGYYDGIKQGRKNASKEIAHLFDLHLEVKCKSEKANKNQLKALEKFNEFLEYHKSGDET